MKKSLLFLLGPLVFACGSLSAQTTYLTADFESGMPAGWTASPATGAWLVPLVTSSAFTPPAHTTVCGINDDASQTSANPASTITTPVINLSAATVVFLRYECFYGGLTYQSITEVADLRYSIDGGATYTTYGNLPTGAAWTSNAINLSTQLAGQANVKIQWRYNDGGGWLYGAAIDDISVFTPAPNDASLTVVTPTAGSAASYGVVAGNINIGGTITNEGTNAITSIAIKYNDGTTTSTYNLSSINIASFGTLNFTHNIPYNIPSLGAHPITVWVELSGDGNQTNDTLGTIVNGASFIPNHHVTVEEGTGTWCGWCVRGMVFMDQAFVDHPTDIDLIAVHNGDPMVHAAYDAGIGALIGGYPSCLINRDTEDDPSNIEAQYLATIGNFGFANISSVVTFNASTRVVTVVASANFAVDLSGDFRLACSFTEDNVTGTASTYNQANYYSGGGNGPMNMPGYDFAVLPNPVPAAQMVYDFVARNIAGGFVGQAGSLPATITAGSTHTYTFTYTVPAAYDVTEMKAIVLLIDNRTATKHILNSAGQAIPVGIETPAALNGVSVYPNPFNQNMNVNVNLMVNEVVTVEMFDMTGKMVSAQNQGELAAGQHVITVDGSNLADGMYFVKITAGTSIVTEKVSVAH